MEYRGSDNALIILTNKTKYVDTFIKVKVKVEYVSMNSNNRCKNRKRNIIKFNPPFNSNVKTNIGSIFLSLIHELFRRKNIFKKNNIKIR